ncbi:hypothetical protein BDY17DRAFT_159044 [Neohortaea acidophila]|uniref:Uncharacterized protein n=1 Tax=Neohortaea acidophila TaxID=245834 RepID=A0A6A6PQK2_9PEZI|nr:uncharacterized protein BDY17DRAFT_159044 [Neohortaea acidophila]KAF2482388.1 hypothetical protein BDY17DRAFT_159044 [Neohortaea acidophila]
MSGVRLITRPPRSPATFDPCNPRAQSGLGLQPVVERLNIACFAKDGVHLLAVFLLSAFSRSILSPLSVPDCPLCTTHILSLAAPLMFGEASLQPQALHIEHSASSPANGNCRPSEDTLVNRRRSSDNTLFERSTMPQACNTITPQEDVARKRSFGIGGAGNIRSAAQIQARIEEDGRKGKDEEGRRDSMWSRRSSRNGSIVGKLFRKGSKSSESAIVDDSA